MPIETGIQWCDGTANPTMGCDGCELWTTKDHTCYAGTLHQRFGGVTKGYAPTFEQVTLFPGRMATAASWPDLKGKNRRDKPWLNGLPRLIFVSDMSDALSNAVTFEYLKTEIIDVVNSEEGRKHCWLWPTKRPKRMAELSKWLGKWPTNLWAGTSVTTQPTVSRVADLMEIGDDKTLKFISAEPQREFIDLSEYLPDIDWVIQGGESGMSASVFNIAWAYDMIDQCAKYKVAYFLKQLGSNVVLGKKQQFYEDAHAGDWGEWDRLLRIRQMPEVRFSMCVLTPEIMSLN
jgi:protein gp37